MPCLRSHAVRNRVEKQNKQANKIKQRFLFEANVLGLHTRVSSDRRAESTVEWTVQTSKEGTLWSRRTAARIKPSPRGESILALARDVSFILDASSMKTIRRKTSGVNTTYNHTSTQPWLFDLAALACTLWTMSEHLLDPWGAQLFFWFLLYANFGHFINPSYVFSKYLYK